MTERDLTSWEESISVNASTGRVFDALSNPELLRVWFADEVLVEARVGGKFAFWGRRTMGTPTAEEATQRVTAWDPPRSIAFTWTLENVESEMRFELREAGGQTEVKLIHALPGNELILTWWLARDNATVLLHNLRAHVERSRPAVEPDYSRGGFTADVSVSIAAEPAEVFRALTDPEAMAKWLTPAATVDLKPGGAYSFGWTETGENGEAVPVGPRKVLEVEPGRKLVHDWQYTGEPDTQATWTIQGEGGCSTLRVTHSGFGTDCHVAGYIQGWAGFLCLAKAALERR
jgi:uncharacterized protein YndB with AHSA1/START domain